ncbi:MAG: HD domain-containing protein [Candidatus Thalassarchaeaceae archaeon]|tara:strand:- start:810 stop:1316 length:507 start_codon:yes stop_codon:yes gene_type:complete
MPRETFIEILGLKDLDRAGWLKSGLTNVESVAAHSWGVAFLAFHLCPEELDRKRLMEMAICHDVAEVKVGDITPYDGISSEDKVAMETEAMLEISSKLPRGVEMLELYREYEAGITPEARFLKLCDKLDMALQSYEYQNRTDVDLSNFRITASKLVIEYGFPDLLRNK